MFYIISGVPSRFSPHLSSANSSEIPSLESAKGDSAAEVGHYHNPQGDGDTNRLRLKLRQAETDLVLVNQERQEVETKLAKCEEKLAEKVLQLNKYMFLQLMHSRGVIISAKRVVRPDSDPWQPEEAERQDLRGAGQVQVQRAVFNSDGDSSTKVPNVPHRLPRLHQLPLHLRLRAAAQVLHQGLPAQESGGDHEDVERPWRLRRRQAPEALHLQAVIRPQLGL